MTGQHFLIVHEEPDDGMDVQHAQDCPQHGHDESVFADGSAYACAVRLVEDDGDVTEHFRREPEPAKDGSQAGTEYVTAGRHPIEFWQRVYDDFESTEYDYGLRLSSVQAVAP